MICKFLKVAIFGVVLTLLISTAEAEWVLQDDFEGDPCETKIHDHNAANGNEWRVLRPNMSHSTEILTDLDDSNNMVLELLVGSASAFDLPLSSPVEVNSIATLFYRIRSRGAPAKYGKVAGLTEDINVPYYIDDDPLQGLSMSAYARYNASVQMMDDNTSGSAGNPMLQARSSGQDSYAISTDTWYNVWIVVNTTTDTFEVYSNSVHGGSRSEPGTIKFTRTYETIPGVSGIWVTTDIHGLYAYDDGPLDGFIFVSGTSGEAPHYDDIYVDLSGDNLSNPIFDCGFYGYMDEDLNQDCYINFGDFSEFAIRFLNSCTAPDFCEGADIDISGEVNYSDLGDIVNEWLHCNNPLAPCNYSP